MRMARARREQGASLVEFALVVPLLALMLFGIVDFGFVLNRDTLVNNAAREGAREASLNPDRSAIEDVVEQVLSDLSGTPVVSFECVKPDNSSCTLHDGTNPGTVEPGDRVRVRVEYAHDWITFAPSWVGLGGSTELSKSVEMRVE